MMKIKMTTPGVRLSDRLPGLSLPCGGKGKCGKCLVKASGDLSEPTARELEILAGRRVGNGSEPSLSDGWRLACRTYCTGVCEVEYACDNEPACVDDHAYDHACDTGAQPDAFSDADQPLEAAVDIGTTTIEAVLYSGKKKLISASCPNPQRHFGADVISRIEAASTQMDALTDGLRHAVADLLRSMAKRPVSRAVVTGNTVMLHFFTGLDPSGMACYPFTPASLFGEDYPVSLLLGAVTDRLYLPRCVSAFVGADMVCAILAAKPKPDEVCLIADIGTNGELALLRGGRALCASTAAGPALEGAEISCGMRAERGAIDRVWCEGGDLRYTTIGGEPARGICGSGLISAAAAMLDAGLLATDGVILSGDRSTPASAFTLGEVKITLGEVKITQADIRALQLAKSAIRAGIDTLLGGIVPDRFCIAGNFGRGLDLAACRRIGLFPDDCRTPEILGNAALEGAVMLLAGEGGDQLHAELLELADDATFCERYIDNMLF